jgi:hypothetical protein
MLPEHYKKTVLSVYADKKHMWRCAKDYDVFTRSFGEASYFARQAYDSLRYDPECYVAFMSALQHLDHHQNKSASGFPKRSPVEKVLTIQSALHILCDDTSPIKQNVQDLLVPHATDSQDEYVQAMLAPDFKAPSIGQTVYNIWDMCRYDIAGIHRVSDSVISYYTAARTMKRSFGKGFTA